MEKKGIRISSKRQWNKRARLQGHEVLRNEQNVKDGKVENKKKKIS